MSIKIKPKVVAPDPRHDFIKGKAQENTSVVKKVGKESVVLKQGVPLDHSEKHYPKDSMVPPFPPRIGMSKGVTKNMDNYESLRIDAWLSDGLMPTESYLEGFRRIEGVLDEVLVETLNQTIEEYSQ